MHFIQVMNYHKPISNLKSQKLTVVLITTDLLCYAFTENWPISNLKSQNFFNMDKSSRISLVQQANLKSQSSKVSQSVTQNNLLFYDNLITSKLKSQKCIFNDKTFLHIIQVMMFYKLVSNVKSQKSIIHSQLVNKTQQVYSFMKDFPILKLKSPNFVFTLTKVIIN